MLNLRVINLYCPIIAIKVYIELDNSQILLLYFFFVFQNGMLPNTFIKSVVYGSWKCSSQRSFHSCRKVNRLGSRRHSPISVYCSTPKHDMKFSWIYLGFHHLISVLGRNSVWNSADIRKRYYPYKWLFRETILRDKSQHSGELLSYGIAHSAEITEKYTVGLPERHKKRNEQNNDVIQTTFRGKIYKKIS